MPFQVEAKLEGLQDVFRKLDGLDKKLTKKLLRKAVGDASKIILKAVKAHVPEDTGQLRRSLGRRVKVYRNSGVVVAIIGPRTGFKDPKTGRNPTKYAHLVEFGTRHTPAHPFMRPGFDEASKEAADAIRQVIEDGLKEGG